MAKSPATGRWMLLAVSRETERRRGRSISYFQDTTGISNTGSLSLSLSLYPELSFKIGVSRVEGIHCNYMVGIMARATEGKGAC